MDPRQERQLNQAIYRQLKESIAKNYPAGQFVAISGGKVIADAEQLNELRAMILAMNKDPNQVLIVQAGVDYLESAVIFLGINGQ